MCAGNNQHRMSKEAMQNRIIDHNKVHNSTENLPTKDNSADS